MRTPRIFVATMKIPGDPVVSCYAGFEWSEAGLKTPEDGEGQVAELGERVRAPSPVTVAPAP